MAGFVEPVKFMKSENDLNIADFSLKSLLQSLPKGRFGHVLRYGSVPKY
jgi:hypothetical protein